MNTEEEKVARNEQIRRLYGTGKYTYERLSEKYNVSCQRIGQIVTGSCLDKLKKKRKKLTKFGIDVDDVVAVQKFLLKRASDNSINNPIFENLKGVNKSKLTGIGRDGGGRDRFRELVRLRDNHNCQWCGTRWSPGRRRFDVHHIIGSKDDTKATSGNQLEMITVCHKCHLNIDVHKMAKSGV